MELKLKDNKYIRLLMMSIVIIIAMSFVQDFADFLSENSEKVVKFGVNQNCNPSTAICSASLVNEGNFQRISFAIKGLTAVEKKFNMQIKVTGFDFEGIESIKASLLPRGEELLRGEELPRGADLDNYTVSFVPDKSTHLVVAEIWDAEFQLPAAVTGAKGLSPEDLSKGADWLAVVRLKSTKKDYIAEFPFTHPAAK